MRRNEIIYIDPAGGETGAEILRAYESWRESGRVEAYYKEGISCTGEVITYGPAEAIRGAKIAWTGKDKKKVEQDYSRYKIPPGMSSPYKVAPHKLDNNESAEQPVYEASVSALLSTQLVKALRKDNDII